MAFLATLRPMRLAHPAQHNTEKERFQFLCVFTVSCRPCPLSNHTLTVAVVRSQIHGELHTSQLGTFSGGICGRILQTKKRLPLSTVQSELTNGGVRPHTFDPTNADSTGNVEARHRSHRFRTERFKSYNGSGVSCVWTWGLFRPCRFRGASARFLHGFLVSNHSRDQHIRSHDPDVFIHGPASSLSSFPIYKLARTRTVPIQLIDSRNRFSPYSAFLSCHH